MKLSFQKPTRWNLKRLYPNESVQALSMELSELKKMLSQLKNKKTFKLNSEQFIDEQTLQSLSDMRSRLEKAYYYCYCLQSEATDQTKLTLLHNEISSIKSDFRSLVKPFITDLDTATNNEIEEKIINFTKNELSHWNQMYIQLKKKLKMNMNDGDQKLTEEEKDLFATVLNHVARLRLVQNQNTNKSSILSESLELNGISHKTLQTMWGVIEKNLANLTLLLDFKKKEENIHSWDQFMNENQKDQTEISFSKAVEKIYYSLEKVDVEMAQFVLKAIKDDWVDAEPRRDKPQGGFCVPFIQDGESRISLNFNGTVKSARILAHELGHAWHFKQMKDKSALTFLDDHLPMSIAECSSIFFEIIFLDHLIESSDQSAKKSLLNYKLQNSINYLMAVRGAFMFEQLFYEKSKNGALKAADIELLSIQSQKKAFGDSLDQYQPSIWIKYGHFYEPNIPFYNYPYTFGYLLSLGLSVIAKENGNDFKPKFKIFLSETGKKPVKELLQEHFHIDIENPEFWQQSIHLIFKDIKEYISIVEDTI
ncbi:M3 family metallopeptidase [Chengkuizengella axinellae]|uniref:Oligoendopeptidase F n=1 Tax=Chengkuizengella axinellae TaxID=3064388 RepID=A0ABT9IUD5_9BACL|nr:M3 family metallopeptidase [Chengkuizengella sp. 2205SS18-9]MDP5272959.1 oligoendopeptidase F [Chengkuizengella sp. 2205SS18-9]